MPTSAGATLLVAVVSLLLPAASTAEGAQLALSGATVVLGDSWAGPTRGPVAARLLLGELWRRGISGWELGADGAACDPTGRPCVHLLRSALPACHGHPRSSAASSVSLAELAASEESFALCRTSANNVTVVAATELGLMMGVGRLLREIQIVTDGDGSHATLPEDLHLTYSFLHVLPSNSC